MPDLVSKIKEFHVLKKAPSLTLKQKIKKQELEHTMRLLVPYKNLTQVGNQIKSYACR